MFALVTMYLDFDPRLRRMNFGGVFLCQKEAPLWRCFCAYNSKLGTLERLAKLAEKYPKLAIHSTQLIISADFENVILWQDDLKKILSTVLQSGDAEAMKIARSIIQDLGAKGYLEYRVLLTE